MAGKHPFVQCWQFSAGGLELVRSRGHVNRATSFEGRSMIGYTRMSFHFHKICIIKYFRVSGVVYMTQSVL